MPQTINTFFNTKTQKYMSTNKLQLTTKQLKVIGISFIALIALSQLVSFLNKPAISPVEALKVEASQEAQEAETLITKGELKKEGADLKVQLAENLEKQQNLGVEQKAEVKVIAEEKPITAEQVETKVSISNQAIPPKQTVNTIFNEHEARIYNQCNSLGLTLEQTAFVLANTRHETAQYKYLKEIDGRGQARRLGYQGGENWYGRGYIQLTHLNNYKNWSQWTGKDLVGNPDLLTTDLDLSAFVACSGIQHGSFTAKGKVSDYINDTKKDYYNARSLVNGDKHKIGNKIVEYTNDYINKLKTL